VEILVTQEWIDRANRAGACSVPRVGTPVSALSQYQLIWCEGHQVVTTEEQHRLNITVPLWVLSGYGGGFGDGYGYGYGYGYGEGYGYGDWYGYGDGYVDGSGSGYGDGDGSGSGYGDVDIVTT
jgi:hypothetical protein